MSHLLIDNKIILDEHLNRNSFTHAAHSALAIFLAFAFVAAAFKVRFLFNTAPCKSVIFKSQQPSEFPERSAFKYFRFGNQSYTPIRCSFFNRLRIMRDYSVVSVGFEFIKEQFKIFFKVFSKGFYLVPYRSVFELTAYLSELVLVEERTLTYYVVFLSSCINTYVIRQVSDVF